jgi:hypothetical protein
MYGLTLFMFSYCRWHLKLVAVALMIIFIFLMKLFNRLIDVHTNIDADYMAILGFISFIVGLLLPNLKYPPSKQANRKNKK